jgi:RNA polymerase sigma-B factor
MTAATTTIIIDIAAAAAADGSPPRLVSNRGRSRPVPLGAGIAGDGASAGVLATHPAGGVSVQDLLRQRADLLAALPMRQRRILVMRYVGEMTQAEIATQVGLSQMHVSRLLQRMLTQLRTGMLAD